MVLIIAFLCDLSYIGITRVILIRNAARENNTAASSKDFISTVSSAGLTVASQASSDLMKGEKTADGAAAAVELIRNPETASGLSLGVTSENNKSTDLVQVTTLESVELSQDQVVSILLLL